MKTRVTGLGVLLGLLLIAVLLAVHTLLAADRPVAWRRQRRQVVSEVSLPAARPTPGPRLAFWLGAGCRRLWREFYYWTIGDDEF